MEAHPAPTEPSPSVEVLGQELLLRSRVFDVRAHHIRLPSGREQRLTLVEHPGAVAIAARFEDGRLALVRQYRHAARRWMLEVPAGRLEPGEDPLAAARRELEEETGLRAERWRRLQSFYPAPGFCTERLHLFLAEGLSPAPAAGRLCPDDDEELTQERLRPEELLARGPEDAKTLILASLLVLAQR
jgi:ADP-ribose pyrophosphatase